MKNFILKRLFTGCIPVLILAGCFNPSVGELPTTIVPPLSVEIEIGGDTLTARSLYDAARAAGPQASSSMSLINNYANFAQLVMMDKNGIAYAGEVWKEDGKNAVFTIRRINYDSPQLFLLLMGHWAEGAKNPTLLASGFTPKHRFQENPGLYVAYTGAGRIHFHAGQSHEHREDRRRDLYQ